MQTIKFTFIIILSLMLFTGCSNKNNSYNDYLAVDEFTGEDAVEVAKDNIEYNEDVFFVYVDKFEYIDGKKIYQVCVKSESQMEQGGSGTISVIKINEDGKMLN